MKVVDVRNAYLRHDAGVDLLFERSPHAQCIVVAVQRRMQQQRIDFRNAEIRQRRLHRLLDLFLEWCIRIVRQWLRRILKGELHNASNQSATNENLSADWREFRLNEQFVSSHNVCHFANRFTYTFFIVVFWLTCGVDATKAVPNCLFDQRRGFQLLPSRSVNQLSRRVSRHCSSRCCAHCDVTVGFGGAYNCFEKQTKYDY